MQVTRADDGQGLPVFSWAVNADEGAYEQAYNLARLPFAIHHIGLMPDAHQGYGMPIGGVLFADRAVVPYAIGVDIGCGVLAVRTDITEDQLVYGDTLTKVLNQIEQFIPVGEGRERHINDKAEAAYTLAEGLGGLPDSVAEEWMLRATPQLGTLGGGNHFIELQKDPEGVIYVMIHSGSRSLGHNICTYYQKLALSLNEQWHSILPHKELAYLPLGTEEFDKYWSAMEFALRFAELNREKMLYRVYDALSMFIDFEGFDLQVDVHHNYAVWENHYNKNGIVHRKGAVRAREGETVLIPGSMGTASYIAQGLGNPKSFQPCQHGAGRAVPRGKTHKLWTTDDVKEQVRQAGVALVSGNWGKAMEEAPLAYKDIEAVMTASSDLIRPITRLLPVGVVKG